MTTPDPTTQLTMLDRVRIQMEYAVPLVRDLQRLLGADVVNEALARRNDVDPDRVAPGATADFGRVEAGVDMFAAGGALTLEVVGAGDDHFDMNVTDCAYAAMMDDLGARDIGHLLVCNLDFAAAAKVGMQLERSQTRMQGADHCDFRYRRAGD